MASILVLTQKAEVKTAKLSVDKNVTLEHIQKYFKKKTEPEFLGSYNCKSTTLFLFGYTKGKAGTENKHELPPPHDSTLVFGDIVLIASKDENSFTNPITFKIEDYEIFYSRAFGGFDDLDEDDDDDDVDDEEEIIEEDIIEEEIIEEENYDQLSYVSEEEVVVKKEKKKSKATNVTISTFIHPDKQLKENSDKNDSPLRKNIIKIIDDLFDFNNEKINEFEQEIYNSTLKEGDDKHIIKDWSNKNFVTLYKCIARKYIGNLCSSSYVKNNELHKRFENNEISFKDICSMNYYDLYSSKWKDSIEQQKNIEKRQLEGNKQMATDQFLCTRCFKRECTYYEMQTRSADEPMTIFINCLNCGKNWRQ